MKRQYVGIDLHRRSSTIYRMSEDGDVLGCQRILSQPFELAEAMAEAGDAPEVVLESTYGWYWAADLLKELGCNVHLAHALGNNWGNRRVKNDERDAKDLAAMLRLGRLAEGWIAPPETRELRELVRYRFSLVAHRTSAKAQIHGVMAKNGVLPVVAEMWGPAGTAQLDSLELPFAYSLRIESLRDLLELYDREITMLDRHIHRLLKDDPSYRAITKLPGVGRVIAAIFIAEIGDITRFDCAKKLCSWAGLTPKHRESDEVVRRGAITKQGSAAIEAVGNYRQRGDEKLRADYRRIAERRGKYKARAAVARKLLTLVYYGLRDGEVRCLEAPEAA
jgi:transposase